MSRTSWVELCVSDFEQSITWFEHVLSFRVVAREANEYAELSRGETSLQLAADDAPYWKPERPRLLPPGQRGSGVEVILLVDNVDAVYHQAQQARADIVRPLADYPWHMRQFWVRHPDGYLIRPAQQILSVNAATYRRQVADAFRRDTPRITQELLAVKQTADTLAQEGDVLGAATIYETMVMEIFEQSHLYYEEAEYDDYYEEEGYYPEEEGLEEFVGESIEVLGSYLADKQTDRVAREKSIAVLFAIYRRDLHADDSHGFAERAAEQLVRYATPLERQTIAEWIREVLADEEQEIAGSERQTYGKFWLDLQNQPGRAEEEKPDWRVLEWLQKYYRDRGNHVAELEMAEMLFRTQPSLKRYQELRDLSERLDRWEGLRRELLAFLEQARNTSLLIQIALDEGDIDQALQRLQGTAKKDGYGYTYSDRYSYYGYSDVAFEVARAAEETRPHAAIELYRQFAERLIAMRDRKHYQLACTYLVKMRTLYEKLGEGEAWTSYVTALREQNRNLRALKEELTNAGL